MHGSFGVLLFETRVGSFFFHLGGGFFLFCFFGGWVGGYVRVGVRVCVCVCREEMGKKGRRGGLSHGLRDQLGMLRLDVKPRCAFV